MVEENSNTKSRPLIGQLVENLGAHGIPNIKRAQNVYRKCFWILAFLCGMGLFSWHCYESVTKFLDKDVTVNLDVHYHPKLQFPAITICNLNPVKGSLLKHFTDLDNMLGSGWAPPHGKSPSPPTMPTRMSPSSSTQQNNTMPAAASNTPNRKKRYQDWENTDYHQMDSRHSLIDATTDIIGAMDYEQRVETGHDLKDMLLSCTFQGYPCTPNNFTWFYNYLYGNCYTFNLGLDSKIHEVTTAGPLLGLTMSLYIEQDEYIPDIQQGAGIRVEIHSQKSMSFPEDKGLNVAPGTEAFISVRKTFIDRKGKPFTNCTTETNSTIFSEYFPHVKYSKLMCEKDCFYRAVLFVCNCSDVRYRYDDSQIACNSTNPKDVGCIRMLESRAADIPCGCTFACQEDIFKYVVSYSLWPNDKHKPVVQNGIREMSDHLKKSVENDTSFVEKNVVKINVYYDELTYDFIYHTETYGKYDLLSDLGGNVGLWIGISVLTIVEILELFYDVIMLCCVKVKSAGERPATDKKNNSDVELVDNNAGKVYPESSAAAQKY
ncbi:acid-sensing ion channel 1A-like [Amphiura filiformis]|uniref:acid-sensing ion channel 1A-like n=1 Tax=Amphiura filiformis TaxID=82378 RepID=UPI003B21F8AC